ncbi:hypothetical protein EDB83DRAFT_2316231 [Lactarius deliciosus]|nr:hypothetical protein EDB83DRAFT_2316231 [Lactarius deliciosus]
MDHNPWYRTMVAWCTMVFLYYGVKSYTVGPTCSHRCGVAVGVVVWVAGTVLVITPVVSPVPIPSTVTNLNNLSVSSGRSRWQLSSMRQQQEQEVANERPFLQKERERFKQEATNQEHKPFLQRERLEQEAANQEHERERPTWHHQEHEADDLNCQQQHQTQQITKSFQDITMKRDSLL